MEPSALALWSNLQSPSRPVGVVVALAKQNLGRMENQALRSGAVAVSAGLAAWLGDALGDRGPFSLTRLSGGNSNETLLLSTPAAERILRRPPTDGIAPGAHNMEREHRVLAALAGTPVPAPAALAFADGADGDGPMLVMERIPGVPIAGSLPPGYPPGSAAVARVGELAVEALALLHAVDWRAVGLEGFGRPEGFLERQVERWRSQFEAHRVRQLPDFDLLAEWLAANRPPAQEPAILHGDFHLDNCLFSTSPPIALCAAIDWELATIGDPLLDLGLFLGMWGPRRRRPPAMARVQGATRVVGAPTRRQLADLYAERTGRSVEHLEWYICLSFWKLAAIVEGAYAQHLEGKLESEYARSLGEEVPNLLAEAREIAGL
jgi:aminoglycoside phosphotransferase (APT) family kinase protein